MSLSCENFLTKLRGGFSRQKSFENYLDAMLGLVVRRDKLGVSSCVRAYNKGNNDYRRLLHVFESRSVKLPKIEKEWSEIVRESAEPAKIEDRIVLVTDTIKIPKEGKKQVAQPVLSERQKAKNDCRKRNRSYRHSYK